MTLQGAPFRLLRTAAVAGAVLSLAAGAHVLAGGRLPPAPVMAACTALVILGVVLVTRWKLTAPALTAILAAGQGLLHEAFSALSGSTSATAAPTLHLHGTVAAGLTPSAGPGLHRHLQADLDPPMLALHVIATLVTAALLSRGEAALWALAAWLRPLASLCVVRIRFISPFAVPFHRRAMARRWRVLCRHPLRGPPAAACI